MERPGAAAVPSARRAGDRHGLGDAVAPSLQDLADRAVERSHDDPVAADELALAVLDDARRADDGEAVATALRARGLARREHGDLAGARRFLEDAVGASDGRAGALARGSLASVLAASGALEDALSHLERARDTLEDAVDRAPVEMQRGDVLSRLGRTGEASAAFDAALAVAQEAGDVRTEALTRINRAILSSYAGRFDAADEDLRLADEALRARGLHLLAADCRHNRGFVAGRRGEVVAALTWFEEARREHERLGVERPSAWMDECEVLLAVRLASEARELAAAAGEAMARGGQGADAAEADLLLARACELEGDVLAARAAAARAEAAFAEQGRTSWRALATLLVLRLAVAAGTPPPAATASELVQQLASAGWVEQQVEALVLCADVHDGEGDRTAAEAALREASAIARAHPSPTTRVTGWYAEARLRRARGDVAGAFEATRRAVALAADAAVLVGARELRTGALGRVEEVANLGLELAVERGRVAAILHWAEVTRSASVPRRAVRPPADAELQADLAALREASRQVEDATLAGDDAADALQQRDALERRVVRRGRLLRSADAPRATSTLRMGELRDRLADRSLLELLAVGGRLVGVHVTARRSRVVELGSVAEVASIVDALRFAAGRALTGAARPSSAEASRTGAEVAAGDLAATLLGPWSLGDGGLVVIPTGPLHGVPWAMLPPLQGRPVVVAPSAGAWLRATDRRSARPWADGAAVVVSGPDVPGVEDEVAGVAACHRDVAVLDGEAATVDAVTGALAGDVRIAHVAAHGRLRSDNPLFSALLVHDGPLTVHDLDAIGAAPELVYLSACDVGRPERHRVDGTAGVVSAFLELGTSTLVASVLPVPHELAARVAVAFHRGLTKGGLGPAEALSAASLASGWTPFTAFGSG